MFYPPKGDTQYLTRGPIVFTYVLSPEGRTEGGPIIFTYVLSPEGRCEAYPVGVHLFLLMFYFVLGNELWKKKKVTQV